LNNPAIDITMKKLLFLPFIFLIIITLHADVFAQQTDFRLLEDSLARMSNRIWQQKEDLQLKAGSELFADKFKNVLELPGSFEYPFDSLKGIGKLKSDDNRFRIFTWNIQTSDGRFYYKGLISTGGEHPQVFALTDAPGKHENRDADFSTPQNWYGALYFKIVPSRIKKQNVYLLLGWDGIDNNSNSKLIDILSFSTDGSPLFGMPVFHTQNGVKSRVVIEYAEDAALVLRYDYQTLLLPKGKSVKRKKMWMIVTDHLVPMDPRLEGQYNYYVPSGETYDAFIYRKGKWLFAEGVEANNPSTGRKTEERKPVNYNLFPLK